ncbi:TonB-dependent siderophore receptor [Runella sp. SP2]|uniref:TonB-dependent receptor plug domain-containing protein n=1 Tax=Runella sp. SP2 TaxID=2268026 RepID=UPI000F08563E|nr:TonB-dependent receptor [Runella sp. SP2]AYQ32139.1 TonB-dependent receptor [Runella sp. SP2]
MVRRTSTVLVSVLGIALAGFSPNCYSQKEQTLCEVTVTAVKPERFMIGQKVKDIDSAQLAQNRFTTLANFLQFQSPIAFRSYGAGQLATISFRGTSSSHTAVLWNGVNINFPSLGQSDFSTLPMSGFDEMTIQYGSAASCVGTDAVGGSILLRSVPKFNQTGLQAIAGVSAESSKNFAGQAGLRFYYPVAKNWKLSGKTLFYGADIRNDFGNDPIQNRKGAQYPVEPMQTLQKGFVQDIYALHSNGNLFSLNAWITDNNLTIQPNSLILREITQTKAQRYVLSYNVGKTLLRAAYINDVLDYGRADNTNPSHTNIDRYLFRVEHDFSWIKSCERGTNLKVGSEVTHYAAQVDGYGKELKTENRADFYMLLRYQHSLRFSSSLNLRQALVSGYNPPFTPSLGLDYRVFSTPTDRLNLTTNIAYSYRVPTLNERYWVNLGNPALQPEVGFNKEIGAVWKRRTSEHFHQQYSVNAFHNLIDNWTYWNPDKNYKVENLQQVLAKGIEIETSHRVITAAWEATAQFQYALTHSSQQKAYGHYTQDILGKQLIYVPRHSLSGTLGLTSGAWSFTVQQLYNSARYITFDHSGRPFPGYYLMNAWATYQYKIKQHRLHFQLQGNNLTNTLYPNLKKNAMPMRSVSFNVIFIFNQKK